MRAIPERSKERAVEEHWGYYEEAMIELEIEYRRNSKDRDWSHPNSREWEVLLDFSDMEEWAHFIETTCVPILENFGLPRYVWKGSQESFEGPGLYCVDHSSLKIITAIKMNHPGDFKKSHEFNIVRVSQWKKLLKIK